MTAGRILGLDHGQRRIGLALSDELGLTAQPLGMVANRGERTLDELAEIMRAQHVARVVLGLPRNMNGSEGEKALAARDFGTRLQARTGVPVAYMDERLTTVAVQRVLAQTGMSGAKKRRVTDKLAAALILQTWLDRERSGGRNP